MRVSVCHCGMTRERALEVAAAETGAAPRPGQTAAGPGMPGDVRALLAAAALAVLAGLGWTVFAPEPKNATVPVLGYVDARPATARRPAPARPPFKLPWWK
jgi:hypothetical protein